MPPSITDRTPREGDEQFITITGRRPTIEYAVASVAERLIPVRRGISVVGLLTGPSAAKGIPHVTGVRTMDGEEVPADLIVDAMGRRSRLPNWLKAIGARRPIEEAEDSGFIYYTRFFRSTTGMVPPCRAALQTHFHSFSVLTLPGDAGTWSVTLFISSGDQAAEVVRQHLGDPIALMLAQDSMTETRVTPWYRNTIEVDRTRIARFNALIQGRREPQPTDAAARIAKALLVAIMYDADLFRASTEFRSMLELPQEIMARPGVVDRIMEVAGTHEAVTPPGPSREELLHMLA